MKIAHEEDAERSVIGAILLRNDALDRIELKPEQFYHPGRRQLFASFLALRKEGKPIDPVTVGTDADLVELTECASFVPTADNIEHYASLVASAALDRDVRLKLSEVIHADVTGAELVEMAHAAINSVGSALPDPTRGMDLLVMEAVRAMQRTLEGGSPENKIPTGLSSVDQIIGGLKVGVLSILAGRPSMGKSSLARTIVDNASLRGLGVHVFSLEDTGDAYATRALADRARVDLRKLDTLQGIQKGEFLRVQEAANELYGRKCWLFDDSTSLSSRQISLRVRKHRKRNDTKLVVVDYAQLVAEPGRDDNERLTSLANALVHLARSENLAVLLLSQLNRDNEKRDDKRPVLSDLRGSGTLEQVANTVLFVHRPEMYASSEGERARLAGQAWCLVRKNKQGVTGEALLRWDGPCATYRDG